MRLRTRWWSIRAYLPPHVDAGTDRFRGTAAEAVDASAPDGAAPLVERGSFAHGACATCDWLGPARRARGVARRDSDLHLVVGCVRDETASAAVCRATAAAAAPA